MKLKAVNKVIARFRLMIFMPHNFLLVWLVQLLSISILGAGIYILYEWYQRELVGTSYLVAGLVMILWTFAGRFISLPLLRRPGNQEPKFMRSNTVQRLLRPDGSVLQVEF